MNYHYITIGVIVTICLSLLFIAIYFAVLTYSKHPEIISDDNTPTDNFISTDSIDNFVSTDNFAPIPAHKNKVLIISCYGYGNMGDNMYAEVFTKYLSDCEVVKISDHSIFVNSNKEILRKAPLNNYPFDFLIIGGGGLITSKKLKDSLNMPYYINDAKKRNKPLFIVSCGIQGPITNFKTDFAPWKDAMNYAKFITVRSKKDKELLSKIVETSKVHYFRDLGYIFPHTLGTIDKKSSKTTTLIIAGPVHDNNDIIKKAVSKKNVIIMNIGSLKDDDNNKRMLKMDFKNTTNVVKYYGAGKSPEFTNDELLMIGQNEMEHILKTNSDLNGVNPSDLTLSKVINIIINSEIVYTGRYHGMIFSRSLGIPYDTLGMDTNKIKWEESMVGIKETVLNSYNNIKLLRQNMNLSDNSAMDIMDLNESISINC